jgi:predicted DCC family thiol-disulfide oxidoreductase YuxK
MSDGKVTVYFDGECHLCSREIDYYRQAKGNECMAFIDITDRAFDARREGLDAGRVYREMHVRRADGSLAVGVDAFIAIWETLPGFRWAACAARWKPVHFALRLGYAVFARLRPYLPRRRKSEPAD